MYADDRETGGRTKRMSGRIVPAGALHHFGPLRFRETCKHEVYVGPRSPETLHVQKRAAQNDSTPIYGIIYSTCDRTGDRCLDNNGYFWKSKPPRRYSLLSEEGLRFKKKKSNSSDRRDILSSKSYRSRGKNAPNNNGRLFGILGDPVFLPKCYLLPKSRDRFPPRSIFLRLSNESDIIYDDLTTDRKLVNFTKLVFWNKVKL